MDREKLKQLIQKRHPGHYNGRALDFTVGDINQMNPEVQRRTFKFLETGEVEDADIEGYTMKKLTGLGFEVAGAFLMQDALVKDPEKAKAALRRGFDSIKVKLPEEKK